MNELIEREILGEYADQGFSLEEDGDHTLLLYFKDLDKEIATFSQLGPTEHQLRETCRQYLARLNNPVGAADL